LSSIWEICYAQGESISSFEEKEEAWKSYFKNLFKEPLGCLIDKILKVINLFPRVFIEEMNDFLKVEVTKDEIWATLYYLFYEERKETKSGFFNDRILSRFL
jgi:hypothetical protein